MTTMHKSRREHFLPASSNASVSEEELANERALEVAILLSKQQELYDTNMYEALDTPEDEAAIQELMEEGMSRNGAALLIFERKIGSVRVSYRKKIHSADDCGRKQTSAKAAPLPNQRVGASARERSMKNIHTSIAQSASIRPRPPASFVHSQPPPSTASAIPKNGVVVARKRVHGSNSLMNGPQTPSRRRLEAESKSTTPSRPLAVDGKVDTPSRPNVSKFRRTHESTIDEVDTTSELPPELTVIAVTPGERGSREACMADQEAALRAFKASRESLEEENLHVDRSLRKQSGTVRSSSSPARMHQHVDIPEYSITPERRSTDNDSPVISSGQQDAVALLEANSGEDYQEQIKYRPDRQLKTLSGKNVADFFQRAPTTSGDSWDDYGSNTHSAYPSSTLDAVVMSTRTETKDRGKVPPFEHKDSASKNTLASFTQSFCSESKQSTPAVPFSRQISINTMKTLHTIHSKDDNGASGKGDNYSVDTSLPSALSTAHPPTSSFEQSMPRQAFSRESSLRVVYPAPPTPKAKFVQPIKTEPIKVNKHPVLPPQEIGSGESSSSNPKSPIQQQFLLRQAQVREQARALATKNNRIYCSDKKGRGVNPEELRAFFSAEAMDDVPPAPHSPVTPQHIRQLRQMERPNVNDLRMRWETKVAATASAGSSAVKDMNGSAGCEKRSWVDMLPRKLESSSPLNKSLAAPNSAFDPPSISPHQRSPMKSGVSDSPFLESSTCPTHFRTDNSASKHDQPSSPLKRLFRPPPPESPAEATQDGSEVPSTYSDGFVAAQEAALREYERKAAQTREDELVIRRSLDAIDMGATEILGRSATLDSFENLSQQAAAVEQELEMHNYQEILELRRMQDESDELAAREAAAAEGGLDYQRNLLLRYESGSPSVDSRYSSLTSRRVRSADDHIPERDIQPRTGTGVNWVRGVGDVGRTSSNVEVELLREQMLEEQRVVLSSLESSRIERSGTTMNNLDGYFSEPELRTGSGDRSSPRYRTSPRSSPRTSQRRSFFGERASTSGIAAPAPRGILRRRNSIESPSGRQRPGTPPPEQERDIRVSINRHDGDVTPPQYRPRPLPQTPITEAAVAAALGRAASLAAQDSLRLSVDEYVEDVSIDSSSSSGSRVVNNVASAHGVQSYDIPLSPMTRITQANTTANRGSTPQRISQERRFRAHRSDYVSSSNDDGDSNAHRDAAIDHRRNAMLNRRSSPVYHAEHPAYHHNAYQQPLPTYRRQVPIERQPRFGSRSDMPHMQISMSNNAAVHYFANRLPYPSRSRSISPVPAQGLAHRNPYSAYESNFEVSGSTASAAAAAAANAAYNSAGTPSAHEAAADAAAAAYFEEQSQRLCVRGRHWADYSATSRSNSSYPCGSMMYSPYTHYGSHPSSRSSSVSPHPPVHRGALHHPQLNGRVEDMTVMIDGESVYIPADTNSAAPRYYAPAVDAHASRGRPQIYSHSGPANRQHYSTTDIDRRSSSAEPIINRQRGRNGDLFDGAYAAAPAPRSSSAGRTGKRRKPPQYLRHQPRMQSGIMNSSSSEIHEVPASQTDTNYSIAGAAGPLELFNANMRSGSSYPRATNDSSMYDLQRQQLQMYEQARTAPSQRVVHDIGSPRCPTQSYTDGRFYGAYHMDSQPPSYYDVGAAVRGSSYGRSRWRGEAE